MSDLFGDLFGGAPDYGKLAAKSERNRRGIVDLGTQQINALYQGGSAPFYSLAKQPGEKFSTKNTYYSLQGGKFKPYWAPKGRKPAGQSADPLIPNSLFKLPDAFGGFANKTLNFGGAINSVFGGDDKSPREIARRSFNQNQLFKAPNMETFEGFQQPFYDERAKAYENFALPQLGDQYRNARDAMVYGLSNRGLNQSTIADRGRYDLEKTTGSAKQQIVDTGIGQANQLKQDVEASRQNALKQLYQTADPAQAFQSAINTSSQFRNPSVFAPLGNMFAGLANQYMTSQLLKGYQQPGMGGYSLTPNVNTPLGPNIY
jgi:hypothetical protein